MSAPRPCSSWPACEILLAPELAQKAVTAFAVVAKQRQRRPPSSAPAAVVFPLLALPLIVSCSSLSSGRCCDQPWGGPVGLALCALQLLEQGDDSLAAHPLG